MLRSMAFFALIPLILIGAWIYIWRRIVLTSKMSRKWNNLVMGSMGLCLIFQLIAPRLFRTGLATRSPTSVLFFSFTFGLLGLMDLLLFFTILKICSFSLGIAFLKIMLPKQIAAFLWCEVLTLQPSV